MLPYKSKLTASMAAFCAILLIGTTSVVAQVPRTISYQGVLDQSNGTPVTDGTYTLTFRIYSSHLLFIGGRIVFVTDTLWTETQNVTVSKGIFNVILGSLTPLNLPFDQSYTLGITVGTGPELTPRIALTSSAYSIRSEYADTASYVAGGGTGGGGITGVTAGTGLVGGGTSGNVTLSAAVPLSLSSSSTNSTITGLNTGSGYGLSGSSNSGAGVYASSSSYVALIAQGNSDNGLDASSASLNGVYGVNTNTNDVGLLGTPYEGAYGFSTNGYGVHGKSTSTNSVGVYGESSDGDGVEGISSGGYGVYGYTSTSNATLAGVWGVDNSGGYGVSGFATSGAAIYGDNVGTGLAGSFKGNVYINGAYTATGTKTAEVKLDNGSPVRLFCEEATEVYFTDYGQSHLVDGTAHVSLDPTYLQTVTIDAQHPMMVFVQVEGNCKGVYVTNKTTTGFDVDELEGGTSNVSFSYRIVCKRKYFADERLATPAQDDATNKKMMEKVWPEVIAQQQQDAARAQAMVSQQKKAAQDKMQGQ